LISLRNGLPLFNTSASPESNKILSCNTSSIPLLERVAEATSFKSFSFKYVSTSPISLFKVSSLSIASCKRLSSNSLGTDTLDSFGFGVSPLSPESGLSGLSIAVVDGPNLIESMIDVANQRLFNTQFLVSLSEYVAIAVGAPMVLLLGLINGLRHTALATDTARSWALFHVFHSVI